MPNVKVIKFIRQNTVKTAVSGLRGSQTHALCGQSNARGKTKSCIIPDKLNVTVRDLLRQVSVWQVSLYRDEGQPFDVCLTVNDCLTV